MTKLKFFLLLLIIVANSKIDVLAQTTVHVEASETHAPLPYATVVNHTKHLLSFADEDGNVINNFEPGDSINISYVGYENLYFIFAKQQALTFLLTPKKSLLNTVEIKTCISRKFFEYSNEEDDKPDKKFGGLVWNLPSENINAKVAVMVTPPFKDAYLKGFSFWLFNNFQAPKVAIMAPIRFSFYEIDDSTTLPGELILDRQIIYFPKKQGKQKLTLDSLHLKIPNNGIYIAIEYIIEDKYKFPVKYFDKEKGVDSVGICYGARIDGVISKDFRSAFNNYLQDDWYYAFNRNKLEMKEPHGTLKFSVEISYCSEDDKKGNRRQ